jgi:hypothetical protein
VLLRSGFGSARSVRYADLEIAWPFIRHGLHLVGPGLSQSLGILHPPGVLSDLIRHGVGFRGVEPRVREFRHGWPVRLLVWLGVVAVAVGISLFVAGVLKSAGPEGDGSMTPGSAAGLIAIFVVSLVAPIWLMAGLRVLFQLFGSLRLADEHVEVRTLTGRRLMPYRDLMLHDRISGCRLSDWSGACTISLDGLWPRGFEDALYHRWKRVRRAGEVRVDNAAE